MRDVTLKTGRVVEADKLIAEIRIFCELRAKVVDGRQLTPDERVMWNEWVAADSVAILLELLDEATASC